jgi:hypothetical protein
LTRAFCATLIGTAKQRVADGHMLPGPATVDLLRTLADAFTASLNAEPEARRGELSVLLPGLSLIFMLRLNVHSEVFVIRAGRPDSSPPAFIVQRAVEVDRLAAAP